MLTLTCSTSIYHAKTKHILMWVLSLAQKSQPQNIKTQKKGSKHNRIEIRNQRRRIPISTSQMLKKETHLVLWTKPPPQLNQSPQESQPMEIRSTHKRSGPNHRSKKMGTLKKMGNGRKRPKGAGNWGKWLQNLGFDHVLNQPDKMRRPIQRKIRGIWREEVREWIDWFYLLLLPFTVKSYWIVICCFINSMPVASLQPNLHRQKVGLTVSILVFFYWWEFAFQPSFLIIFGIF